MAIETTIANSNQESNNSIRILHKGLELDNRYIIEDLIGSGGMAAVYSAHDKNLKTKVAIKILDQKYSSKKEFIARFYREAQIAAKLLNHPSITRVTDVGKFQGRLCIVMELIEGRDLEKIISEKNTLPEEKAADITCKVLDALAYAHNNGIIHRDIKPGNIMIAQPCQVKITDFGIAKIIDKEGMPAHTKLTQEADRMMGSIEYISPEQIRNDSKCTVTEKTDVFSTGVMLYHILTGALPYDYLHDIDKNTKETTLTITSSSSLRKRHNNITPEMENIILKAIDKNPEKRYTAEEFRDSLLLYMNGGKVKVEGTLKRKYDLKRRKFLSIGISSIIGLAASLAIPKILINNHNSYIRSIYSTIDKIQKADITGIESIKPYLKELYPKLIDRLLWVYDVELRNEIESEKKKTQSNSLHHPNIYPFSTQTLGAEVGRYAYLNGEGSFSGEIIPLIYLMFDEVNKKVKSESNPEIKESLVDKSRILLDDFFYYSTNLYFAESYTNEDIGKNDDMRPLLDRFFPGFERAEIAIKHDNPKIFEAKKESIRIISNNCAKALKIIIEKRYNPKKGFIESFDFNKYDVSANRDSQIAEFLCNSIKMINLKEQIFDKFLQYGNQIKTAKQYLDLIIKDADTKIKSLAQSNEWLQNATSREYAELLLGLTHRHNLLDDIIQRKYLLPENSLLFAKNITEVYPANPNRRREYELFLTDKLTEYQSIINSMTYRFLQQFTKGSIPGFYFEQRKDDPSDTGAAVLFIKAAQLQRKNNISAADIKTLDKFITKELKAILTKQNIAGHNYLPVSEEHPFGILKGNIIQLNHKSTIGGTQPRSDYNLLEVIRMINE